MAWMGALPARFRRERVLVVGCGDVGLRTARLLHGRVRLLALTSSPERQAVLRAAGITPLLGNLDDADTVRRLSGLATRVLHLAPPPAEQGPHWRSDPRTRTLTRVLSRRAAPRSLVYGSTSGVYGDCQGEWVSESRPVQPHTPRAVRRVDAERSVRAFGQRSGVACVVLRIPGIYANDRPGGTPRDRLLRGTPVLLDSDDVYTNHIHADDLARACLLALWRGGHQRCINVSDHTELKMGDYFDLAADLYGLPRPPRVGRDTAQAQLPLVLLSFMSESRRLHNQRMGAELGLVLRYPTVREGLSVSV
ncbi:MAG: NAD(P)-dependent oxidoreductase [Polaromonas sp.]|nr:NAD(P)-dependent oxidoreductase [Polaromonas sp.]